MSFPIFPDSFYGTVESTEAKIKNLSLMTDYFEIRAINQFCCGWESTCEMFQTVLNLEISHDSISHGDLCSSFCG